ncbi:hypothetical protein TTHERM_00554480 (macronuclear) [Tetrahymena thermophila SB210]|uniref:Uncharacterized protein n=1 Tax=Tetrahymena thermophila (strain SB210) TaxID=312017 RepID=Q22UH7_TETTS|nr:hypothetical protein TTHERM_00554480 [Tetrahymena thermophila SB210]EAR88993.1 hypothetical protein TTHERM_00554480 [Tetrahymena thermophila SB210]|eukprot:XP_001009238.1 hypothetical protein TTHERM_00554480 [Tetrahymena thermophila SB210]
MNNLQIMDQGNLLYQQESCYQMCYFSLPIQDILIDVVFKSKTYQIADKVYFNQI